MKKSAIKLISLALSLVVLCMSFVFPTSAAEAQYPTLNLDCRSAVLMEAQSGQILYATNETEALPPASVTKVMTLLLVMEAIEQNKITYSDMVSASEHACSMGGSQIFLEVGEQMSVEDLLKSVVIASANDAAVALAEYIAGTEEAFVQMMNERAEQLGMTSTHFENTNGLDDTTKNHVTSALDIAIMSRELIKHKKITEYSSIWIDSIRNGEFGLTNTNRLIRYYKGATGLKTGSTAKAGFCITATATRDGMTLIAVIMASSTRDARNSSAVSLLNYGFSNFTVYDNSGAKISQQISVVKGAKSSCGVLEEDLVAVIEKKNAQSIEKTVEINEKLTAPVKVGQCVGSVTYSINGKEIASTKIFATENVECIGFMGLWAKLLAKITFK